MIRLICLIAMIGLPVPAMADEKPTTGFAFDHVALSVADVDRSALFYANILGLKEVANRTEVDGIRWFSLGGGKELHLISVVKGPVKLNKAVHFALTTTNFDGFLAALKKSGTPWSSWPGEAGKVTDRADGTRQLYIQDVDGYWIEINSAAGDK